MEWQMVKNDLKRNRIINVTLLLFMTLSASLAVLSMVMAVQTFSSVNQLYEAAQPPHFLQMHKGDINQTEIDEFMAAQDDVPDWQTITMMNVYGDQIQVTKNNQTYDLADTQLDIGLVQQPLEKDLLLNSEHERIELAPGQIGMPMILKERYNLELGDQITLESDGDQFDFILTEFVLDAQMNSTLASSTRVLLSDADYELLAGEMNEFEHLIEVYFTDSSLASNFQTAYENAGLPRNGQAVTYTMMFLLSAFTDLVTVFIMLIVSILLIMVAFVSLRFTIAAALEEDITEIGVMKAIGFANHSIRNQYLNKYRLLAVIGAVSGLVIALLLSTIMTERLGITFGKMAFTPLALILAGVTAFVIYGIIMVFCRRNLRKIRTLTVVDALVSGKGFNKNDTKSHHGLYRVKYLPVNWALSWREVLYQWKEWLIVPLVVILAVLMIMLPFNLLTTIEAPEFVTYMGNNIEDILIEIENNEQLEANFNEVEELASQNPAIEYYQTYRRVSIPTFNEAGESVNLHIDSGTEAGQGLQYLSGRAPASDNEIAISYLNADKIAKDVNDTLTLSYGSQEHPFIISGIYQDVTSGGYTAKAVNGFAGEEAVKYTVSLTVSAEHDAEAIAASLNQQRGHGVNIAPMGEFLDQTLGGVTNQLRGIVLGTLVIGIFMAVLISVLFLQLRLTQEQSSIVTLKAIGFTNKDTRNQYLIKMGTMTLIGLTVGLLLTYLVGNPIVNMVLSLTGLGIKKVNLLMNPLLSYLIIPALILFTIGVVTMIASRRIDQYNIIDVINE